jgi:peptidoglycan/xylan/chitin deacetylase (PgdA/CDA1 family)
MQINAGRLTFLGIWLAGLGALGAMGLGLVPGHPLVVAGVLSVMGIAVAVGVISQSCGIFASPLNRVPGAGSLLALTFDDGPDEEFTPLILDLLAAAGQHATFFVIGERLARCPEVARRAVREGHELACHSMAHRWHMALWPPSRVADDLRRVARLIRQAGGAKPRYFRPPAAVLSPRIAAGARLAGLTLVGYSMRSGDGSPVVPASVVLGRLRRGLEPGGILLLHDGRVGGRAPAACEVLPALLEEMRSRGLQSVPLSRLQRGADPAPAARTS